MGRAALMLVGLVLPACAQRPGAPMVLEQSADARLLVVELPDTVRVEVHSPKGIGRATLRRSGSRWPGHLVLRLHLKGLEGLELVAGSDTVRKSEPTSAGPPASGWYEVEVPGELLEGEAELRVGWVDFYR